MVSQFLAQTQDKQPDVLRSLSEMVADAGTKVSCYMPVINGAGEDYAKKVHTALDRQGIKTAAQGASGGLRLAAKTV